MAKTSGLGDQFAFGGYLIGGDIQALQLHGGPALLDVTDITQSGHSRLGGLIDGAMSLTAYMDPAAAAEHAAFSPLSRADVICTYLRGQALGNPILGQNSRQLNYDFTRATDGSLTEKVDCAADQYGQEWGLQLTPGVRTDTGAANGTSINNAAGATTFGAQMYLQAIALTGTDVTVTVQHSTNNSSFTTLAAFTEIVSANGNLPPSAQRIFVANGTTVNEYVRVITTTAAGFTSFEFIVGFVRNQVSGQV